MNTLPPTKADPSTTDNRDLLAGLNTLGELSGGIAHQMSAPLQSVSANLHFMARAWSQLSAYLPQSRAAVDDGNGDLAFNATEFPRAIAQSIESLNQAAALLQTMKDWSAVDESATQVVDVAALLDRVLLVTHHRWRYTCQIERDYAAGLPALQLRQDTLAALLAQLVLHAVDSIERQGQANPSVLRVSCTAETAHLVLTFEHSAPATHSPRMVRSHAMARAQNAELTEHASVPNGCCYRLRLPR